MMRKAPTVGLEWHQLSMELYIINNGRSYRPVMRRIRVPCTYISPISVTRLSVGYSIAELISKSEYNIGHDLVPKTETLTPKLGMSLVNLICNPRSIDAPACRTPAYISCSMST